MITCLAFKGGVRPPKYADWLPISNVNVTVRAYALAVNVFAGCLMAQPDRPKINDIDNATGEHFGVSGRAIRFDRADVFADLEVWKRDVDPKLWAASKPVLMIGQMALSGAFVRTAHQGWGVSEIGGVPADMALTDIYASEDAIRAAGLAAIALAYGMADAGVDDTPHNQISLGYKSGWELWHRATNDEESWELALRFAAKRDAQSKMQSAIDVAQGWLNEVSLPRISDLLRNAMSSAPATMVSGPPARKPHDIKPRDTAATVKAAFAELEARNAGRVVHYTHNGTQPGVIVYGDTQHIVKMYQVTHQPADLGGGKTITNIFSLIVYRPDRQPRFMRITPNMAKLADDIEQAAGREMLYPTEQGSDDLDPAIILNDDGTLNMAAMNAAAAASFVARDAAEGIHNPKIINLADRAAAAAASTSSPTPAHQGDTTAGDPDMTTKKNPTADPSQPAQPAASNPFKTPPAPKPAASPEAKKSGLGEPLELKNPTSPEKAAAEADEEKMKKLKEAHRAIVHKARPCLTAGLVDWRGEVDSVTIGPVIQSYTEDGVQRSGKLTITLKPAFKDVTARALQLWLTEYRAFDGRAAELADRLADDLAAVVKYDRVKVDFASTEDGLPIKACAKRGYDSPAD